MFLTNVLLFTIVVVLIMIFYQKDYPDDSLPLIFGVSTLFSIFIIGLFYLAFYILSNISF
jgi:hypothetical protein